MNHITNANVLMALFPVIKNEVVRAEQQRLLGSSKLEAVVQAVKAIYQQTSAPIAFEALQGMLERMIEAIVSFYHNTGSFTRSQKLAA